MPFLAQKHKNMIFVKKIKLMCEMLDMAIYGLETETTHPKRLFDNLSFLDFWKNENKLGGIYYCFLAKNVHFLT